MSDWERDVSESVEHDGVLWSGECSWSVVVLSERLARDGWREGARDVHALGGVNGAVVLCTS